MAERIAEVIASSTREFEAEVYDADAAPAFGCWVQVPHDNGTVLFGLVSHVQIGSIEPNRRAVALGKTPDELRREHPHVLELLRTTFRAQVVAYRAADGRIRQTLPPQPAPLHSFVTACTPDLVQRLGRPYDFLRTLVRHPDPAVPADDLIVAVLHQIRAAHDDGPEARGALIDAGRALSRLLNDDHERLQSILRRA